MTINGGDLSIYQEGNGQRIDWNALATDPRAFKFVWIKFSEGEIMPASPGAYPVADAQRQAAEAKAAGVPWGGYHFYYKQASLGNGQYYQFSPTVQAAAFSASMAGVNCRHPAARRSGRSVYLQPGQLPGVDRASQL